MHDYFALALWSSCSENMWPFRKKLEEESEIHIRNTNEATHEEYAENAKVGTNVN